MRLFFFACFVLIETTVSDEICTKSGTGTVLDVKNRTKRSADDLKLRNVSAGSFPIHNQFDVAHNEVFADYDDPIEPHYYTIDENTYTCRESRKIDQIGTTKRFFSEYDTKEECEKYTMLRCYKENEIEINHVGFWTHDQWQQCDEVTFAGFSRPDAGQQRREEYGVSCLYTPCSCIVLGEAPAEAFLYSLRGAYSFEDCETRLSYAWDRNDQFREVLRFNRTMPSFKTFKVSTDLTVDEPGPTETCTENVPLNKGSPYQYFIFKDGLRLTSPIIVNAIIHDANNTLVKLNLFAFNDKMMKRNVLHIAIRVQDKTIMINDKHSGCWSRGYTVKNEAVKKENPFTLTITPEIKDFDMQFTVEYEDEELESFVLSDPLVVEMRPEYTIERYSYLHAAGPIEVTSYCHTSNLPINK